VIVIVFSHKQNISKESGIVQSANRTLGMDADVRRHDEPLVHLIGNPTEIQAATKAKSNSRSSGDNRDRVNLEQQLGPCQRHDLHHGAGWEVRAQDFAPSLVDIPVIAYICGEDVKGDNIVDRPTGGFDGSLNLPQDKTRLRLGVADADDLAVMIRSRLAGNEYHPAWLCNID
jgi:hypothetical protein